MSQIILRRMTQAAIIGQSKPLARPAFPASAGEAHDGSPIDPERIRNMLLSIRGCVESTDISDHLKLYWVSAYCNSLLCRMAVDRVAEADAWLAQLHSLERQIRVELGEETTL